jgi:pimeloyl-ACP methyl ester carboxylesterase
VRTSLRSALAGLLLLGASACENGRRTDADADASLPVDAAAEACVPSEPSTQTVTIAGHFGSLGGSLEMPSSCGPVPLAIVYSGSGTSDRNGGVTRSYRALALALKEAGVASLRWDDEGAGASAGALPTDPREFTYDHELADSAAWTRRFRTDRRFSSLVLMGHSQGALTAALVASNPDVRVDGVVSLAGTSLRAGRLLVTQTPASASAAERQAVIDSVTALEAGREVDPTTLPPRVAALFPPEVQPYFIVWFAYDPLAAYRALRVPTLIVHGATDQLVPPSQADELAAVTASATVRIIDRMAHTLKYAESDASSQRAARLDPEVPLADGLVEAIAGWVHALDAR